MGLVSQSVCMSTPLFDVCQSLAFCTFSFISPAHYDGKLIRALYCKPTGYGYESGSYPCLWDVFP